MSEPRTKAGRALLNRRRVAPAAWPSLEVSDILAIEADERRATVERIRAAVREAGWHLDSPWLPDILDEAAK